MCILCHLNMENDNILHQLNNIHINNFSKIDDNDITTLLLSSSGFNGLNIRKVGIILFKEYKNWCIKNKNKLIFSINNLNNKIIFLENNLTTFNENDTYDNKVVKILHFLSSIPN